MRHARGRATGLGVARPANGSLRARVSRSSRRGRRLRRTPARETPVRLKHRDKTDKTCGSLKEVCKFDPFRPS